MSQAKDQMVARFNRSTHPVNRIKHVRDIQQALPVNTLLPVQIARADDAPALASTEEVLTGSVINGFYATVEVVATESADTKTPNLYVYFAKNPGGNLTFPNGNVVGASDNKKYVFHQEMVMLQGNATSNGTVRNVFKGVLAMPKHMRRMGPNDIIEMYMFTPSTSIALNICAQFHYKEFR